MFLFSFFLFASRYMLVWWNSGVYLYCTCIHNPSHTLFHDEGHLRTAIYTLLNKVYSTEYPCVNTPMQVLYNSYLVAYDFCFIEAKSWEILKVCNQSIDKFPSPLATPWANYHSHWVVWTELPVWVREMTTSDRLLHHVFIYWLLGAVHKLCYLF